MVDDRFVVRIRVVSFVVGVGLVISVLVVAQLEPTSLQFLVLMVMVFGAAALGGEGGAEAEEPNGDQAEANHRGQCYHYD